MSHASEDMNLVVPAESLGDRAHALVRSILGAVPGAGQAAIELFTALVTPPLEKRREEWMRQVGEMLAKLSEERKVNLDQLQQNDAFIDLLMDASQAAMRNAKEEKRQALRNAIQNAALGHAPEESLQHVFVHWVDEFSVWHLRLLKCLDDQLAWMKRFAYPVELAFTTSSLLEHAYPELRDKNYVYCQAWQDLNQRGLTERGPLDRSRKTREYAWGGRLTDIGVRFLRFIEAGE